MNFFIMKTRFLFKTLILTFGLLFFNSCADDDAVIPDEPIEFEPITLDLLGLGVDMQDTAFTLENYNFAVFNGVSLEPEPNGDVNSFENGIGLASFVDGQRSNLTLDLSPVTGVSGITVAMFNNCRCTVVETIDGDGVVLQKFDGRNSIPFGPHEVIIENISESIASLRITSSEAIVRSISLR